jgi:hypothetical protein
MSESGHSIVEDHVRPLPFIPPPSLFPPITGTCVITFPSLLCLLLILFFMLLIRLIRRIRFMILPIVFFGYPPRTPIG